MLIFDQRQLLTCVMLLVWQISYSSEEELVATAASKSHNFIYAPLFLFNDLVVMGDFQN